MFAEDGSYERGPGDVRRGGSPTYPELPVVDAEKLGDEEVLFDFALAVLAGGIAGADGRVCDAIRNL